MTPRYWHVATFRDELDMLRCQLIEHADRLHKFVVIEATVDHSGKPKPLYLQRHWESFREFHDKIEYLVDDQEPTFEQQPDFWVREQQQRTFAMDYLQKSCAPDDILVVSDVDEFVPKAAYDNLLPAPAFGLEQKLRYAAVDWSGSPGVTAVMVRCALLWSGMTTDTLRQQRESMTKADNGGYHFSWFGGPEKYESKAICSPHQETLETALVLARDGYAWQRGCGGIGPGTGDVAEITDDYPVWVKNRECPWYWWRPAEDMLPVDSLAREREVQKRATLPHFQGVCEAGLEYDSAATSAWHAADGTPCASEALGLWQ